MKIRVDINGWMLYNYNWVNMFFVHLFLCFYTNLSQFLNYVYSTTGAMMARLGKFMKKSLFYKTNDSDNFLAFTYKNNQSSK
jgi:hypothetical protein